MNAKATRTEGGRIAWCNAGSTSRGTTLALRHPHGAGVPCYAPSLLVLLNKTAGAARRWDHGRVCRTY